MAIRGIALQPFANKTVEPIEALAHIGRAGCHINARGRAQTDHALIPLAPCARAKPSPLAPRSAVATLPHRSQAQPQSEYRSTAPRAVARSAALSQPTFARSPYRKSRLTRPERYSPRSPAVPPAAAKHPACARSDPEPHRTLCASGHSVRTQRRAAMPPTSSACETPSLLLLHS